MEKLIVLYGSVAGGAICYMLVLRIIKDRLNITGTPKKK
jgi:hypothetical protein